MLEQEKKNLEKLKENESQNANEIGRAEANIRTLQDQLKQSTGDVSTIFKTYYLVTQIDNLWWNDGCGYNG